ncbi:alpha/beta hydrolase [Streptomyces luteireticuli]|uniref:DUF1023 domain-containing protein n=1 Tax=Streptomyces luteireticuli TaxID=173858 RepID=A0ABN0Z427_9ACTN
MVTIDQLKSLDLSRIKTAAGAWGAMSRRSSEAQRRVDNGMIAKVRDTQSGEAADKAVASTRELSRNFQYIHAECGLIETALNGLAEELAGPQKKLKQALQDAEDLKFKVGADGSVEFPRVSFSQLPAPALQQPVVPGGVPVLPGQTDPNAAKAQEIADRIGAVLREATEVDGRYAKTLLKLKTNGRLDQTDWLDVAQDMKDVRSLAAEHLQKSKIPSGKSAKENAAWWKSLTQIERDEYAALYPSSIGALDGLPSVVRDEANRVVLAETHAELSKQLKELEKNPPVYHAPPINPRTGLPIDPETGGTWGGSKGEQQKWREEKEELQEKLKGIESIEERFGRSGRGGLPEAYLLSFDDKGLGRAVVANGNPDNAQHTAIYVPGTTANLGAAGKDIERMEELWRKSRDMPGNPSVSTITWIGYDAPQNAKPFSEGQIVPDAASDSYAWSGGPGLSRFLDGVQTAQGGPQSSHTTVIGHSYGTTTIGAASLKGGLGADDIIAAASPGMLTSHANGLDAPHGHVWSEAAAWEKDNVPLGGKVAGLGGSLVPYGGAVTQVVPSDRIFGANIMQTDAQGHGDYFDKDSVSLKNQAAVVTGNYDLVQRG